MKQKQPPSPRDDSDRQMLADVATHGCHITGVLADEKGPAFSYSTGLFHNFNHPEIIIFGLKHQTMQSLINTICHLIRDGAEFQAGDRSPDIIRNFDCVFRPVGRPFYYNLVGYARWFYRGDDFPLLQCVWPDAQGHFPWEPGCHPGTALAQPLHDGSA